MVSVCVSVGEAQRLQVVVCCVLLINQTSEEMQMRPRWMDTQERWEAAQLKSSDRNWWDEDWDDWSSIDVRGSGLKFRFRTKSLR